METNIERKDEKGITEMCRFIKADYVVSNAFIKLSNQNKSQLSFEDLYQYKSNIISKLKGDEQTIVVMSKSDIYDFVNRHNPAFKIDRSAISFNFKYIDEIRDLYTHGLPKEIELAFAQADI